MTKAWDFWDKKSIGEIVSEMASKIENTTTNEEIAYSNEEICDTIVEPIVENTIEEKKKINKRNRRKK
jgi:hypothetical protein